MPGRGPIQWLSTAALTAGVLMMHPEMTSAELRPDVLQRPRTVTGTAWLQLHLRLLGLELTYPAYRIRLGLNEQKSAVTFDFWISAPLARHLSDAGMAETEKVLTYHASGISNQIQEMLAESFPALAADFDAKSDLVGTFYVPVTEMEAPPRSLGGWEQGRFVWTLE